jgi:anaerobic ribonucleoside-triphosphate reductase activating protein
MNYAKINYNDVANGIGIRVSLFVSGCRHHCKNCFNKDTWDFNYGTKFDNNVVDSIIDGLKSDYVTGLTILGGEPLEPENQLDVFRLIDRVNSELPTKSIWLYTGCTWESLLDKSNVYHTSYTLPILSKVDVLVDGPFVEDLKNLKLKFRGSSNQRIIRSKDSIRSNKLILDDLNNFELLDR